MSAGWLARPPGYVGYEEGGQLTERIRRKPYAVVLLDEIEKAHPDVFNMLLQIMEEGRLTDNVGRVVDFKNVILIMTSNIGADLIKSGGIQGFGYGKRDEEKSFESMKKGLLREVEKFFRPEFINRLDDTIIFRPLSRDNLYNIIDIEIKKVTRRLVEQGISLETTPAARDFLIEKGYNPDFGARPLRRAIEQYLEDPLSESILRGEYKEVSLIRIDRDGEALRLLPWCPRPSSRPRRRTHRSAALPTQPENAHAVSGKTNCFPNGAAGLNRSPCFFCGKELPA